MAVTNEKVAAAALVGGGEITLHSHAGGGTPPAWYGKIVAAMNGGDPGSALAHLQRAGNITPTPTNITATIARCSSFMLPAAVTVNKIRWYGVGATTGLYHVAVYRYSDLARLAILDDFNTVLNTWGSGAFSCSLLANTIYFLAVSVDTTGTTPGVAAIGTTIAATTGQIQTAPDTLPGNLDFDAGILNGYKFQFAVTAGALPATAPTLVAQAVWTGGIPLFFLDNNNA